MGEGDLAGEKQVVAGDVRGRVALAVLSESTCGTPAAVTVTLGSTLNPVVTGKGRPGGREKGAPQGGTKPRAPACNAVASLATL